MRAIAALATLFGLALPACGVPVLEIVYCDEIDYVAGLSDGVDRIEVWPGTPNRYGVGPLAKIESSERVAQTARFFLERGENWYVPASYTTDPGLIAEWGDYSIRFFRDEKEISVIRATGSQLITDGCDAQTTIVLSPEENALIHNFLYSTPLPNP